MEKETCGQANPALWFSARTFRLSASKAKAITNRRPSTSTAAFVQEKLLSRLCSSKATTYGRDHEKDAIQAYKQSNRMATVNACGLFIDEEESWLC